MNRPATNAPAQSSTARSYQQLLTKLLRHGAYPQLRKIVDKTLPADISPVLPLLLEEDRKRVLSLLIESGKAARALLGLDEPDLTEMIESLDDSTIASICASSAPDDAADLLDALDDERRARILELLGATQGAKLESLLEGEAESAGSLMNTEFLALDENLSVARSHRRSSSRRSPTSAVSSVFSAWRRLRCGFTATPSCQLSVNTSVAGRLNLGGALWKLQVENGMCTNRAAAEQLFLR